MTSSPSLKATRKEWIGLAVIALPCMVYAMDLTVLNLALPAISAQLNPSSSQLLWIIDIYGFLVAGLLITMGTLGDRIGRRKLLLIGAAAFGVASAIAAFSDSAGMLIAMRALLGIAGATLAPSTMSLIRNMFHDEHERQFAIGVWIASFSLGSAIGPLVGGVLLTWLMPGNISIATLVGFIAVAGIAARNSIMLLSHYLHLMQHEGEEFSRAMVIRGTQERLIPVLMTALSAGMGLIPLLLAADQPGKEILHPVAVVIVGGLVTSTLLGLGVTPTVFYTFGRNAARKAIEREAAASH